MPETQDPALLFRRFEVREILHRGAESCVAVVHDRADPGRDPVLKWVPGRGPDAPRAQRLESEYRFLAALRHPGLPRALDYSQDLIEDRTWLLLERVPGVALDGLSPLPESEAVAIAVDVCRVLALLHARSVLHLDIKPSNILHHRPSGRTTVLDLDLAAYPESAAGRGTAPYASPEVMGAAEVPDARADLFSLGVTLHALLTGRPARAEMPVASLDPGGDVSRWLRDLVLRLTAADPAERPASAREVIDLLQAAGPRFPAESLSTRRAVLSFPPLTGRGEEMRKVLDVLPAERPKRVRFAAVGIAGGPGSGKSRLVQALAVTWRCAGTRVVEVPAAPAPAASLDPVRRLLRAVLRPLGREAEGTALLAAARGESQPGAWDRLSGLLLNAVGGRRTILVLEDVHRHDQATRDFVLHFLRRLGHENFETRGRAPWQVVLTFDAGALRDDGLRSHLGGGGRDAGPSLLIELKPLSRTATAELVRMSVAPETVPRPVLDLMQDRTGGQPLYVRELLLAHPQNPHGSGTLLGSLAGDAPALESIPDSLEGLVWRRIRTLGAGARKVLDVLALLPRGAPPALLREIAGGGADAAEAIDRLRDEGLASDEDGRLLLSDAITRSVLATAAPPAFREEVRARAASAFESAALDRVEIALLQLGAADPLPGLRAAADLVPELIRTGGEEEAIELLEEVRRRSPPFPAAVRWATIALADLRLGRGQVRKARNLLEGLGTPESGDVSRSRRWAALHAREGRLDAAREILESLAGPSPDRSVSDRIAAGLDLAEMLFAAGREAETRAAVGRVRPLLEGAAPLDAFFAGGAGVEGADPPRFPWPGDAAAPLARWLLLAGDLARASRDFVSGLRCQLAVMKIRARLGDLPGLARALHGVGTMYMSANQLPLAERYFHRAMNLRQEVGDVAGSADTANNLGVLARKLARTAEAIDHFRTSLRFRRQIGHAAGEAWSYINIANVHYERRELDAAVRYLRRALDVARRLSDARSQAQILNNLGAVAHLRDQPREAIRRFRKAEKLDRAAGNVAGAMLKRLNLADEYVRVGWLARADRVLRTVERMAERRADAELAARAALVRGRHERASGRPAEAARVLGRALRGSLPDGDREFAAELAMELSGAELDAGQVGAALEALPADAASWSAEARARLAVARARALLLGDGTELAAAAAELADGERFAERARMPGLRFQCARVRGAIRARFGDLPQAQAAYATAFDMLEAVMRSLRPGSMFRSWVRTPEITGFVAEVERFTAGLVPAPGWDLPAEGQDVARRIRDALFEAERRIGSMAGLSRRHEEVIRRVLDLSRTLRSIAPLDELLGEIVDAVVEFSRAERAFLVTVGDHGRIRIPVARSRDRERIADPEQQISRRIVQEVLRTGRSMRLVNAVADQAWAAQESVVNLDLRSIMCAPLLRGAQVAGMLYVDNRSRIGHFTAPDLELLDVFATQAAIALENARLVREFARDEKIRVLGILAGGVAHDFNNLLAAIKGRAQEVIGDGLDERHSRGLRTILKAAEDGAAVVRRLQDVTRVRREGRFESVPLPEVVEDVLEFTRSRWEGDALRRGFRITVTSRVEDAAHVLGDASEIREVFTNLVLNAIAAMPEGGTLTITGSVEGDHVLATVEDTGIGMSEEVRESIFDPFFSTRGREGMGLGMSIVYGIVLRHRGAIHVDSTPGAGTRIRLELPATAAPLPAPPARPLPQLQAAGLRVLVIDDEEGIRDLLRDVLTRAGFEVETASDGPAALRAFDGRPFEAVVTDLGMRPLSGWDVTRHVKQRVPSTAVVLVTGWAGEIDEATARRHRVDRILTKPFDIAAVVRVVLEAVESTRRRPAIEVRAEA